MACATTTIKKSHGEIWAESFGLSGSLRVVQRERYGFLKEHLIFKMDATANGDPLSSLIQEHRKRLQPDEENHTNSDTNDNEQTEGWARYFSDENLLEEINTDLDRLYPAGHEVFFQHETLLNILRNILFVWCKLHTEVSYRQGMHDVAALVLYSFLKPNITECEKFTGILPESIEADTFLVFEAIMLYLKTFYEVVKSPFDPKTNEAEPRLFGEFTLKENDHPNALFSPSGSLSSLGDGEPRLKMTALRRMCQHVQYELLLQTDPQLHYHLQNLDIVPETYCLRWIRLLFAREFDFDQVLTLWDAMILDEDRPAIEYPESLELTDTGTSEKFHATLPILLNEIKEYEDWYGFPLLRFICIAKLLEISPLLRQEDNTGCLRLLMHSFSSDDENERNKKKTSPAQLVQCALLLQNPMRAKRDSSLDVIEFGPGSLGIILTAAKSPYDKRLAVRDFVPDPSSANGMGQAEASLKIQVGDILESINGVPIVGLTTEEVKRHIQLISRPFLMGFKHVSEETISIPLESADHSQIDKIQLRLEEEMPRFLPGEMCFANVETSIQRFVLTHDGSCTSHYISGKLYMTNYRCFFRKLVANNKDDIDWQVPVLSIAAIDGSDLGSGVYTTGPTLDQAQAVLGFSSDDTYKVFIRCKDTQLARFCFSNYAEYSKLFKCLSCLAFPQSLLDAFCFAYSPTVAPSEEVPFDIRREYQRIGLLDYPERMRCIDQGNNYDLCDTYPQHLILPTAMSDTKIKLAASFRSHNRLPVVCWIHRGNGATISRASQPLVGLKSARCLEDELLVKLLCCSGNEHIFGRYLIVDARGQLAAVGNKAMGKGTEIPSNYRGSKLVFMNIENIHAIRQSFQSLVSIFEPKRGINEESSSSYYSRIENSSWLRHVRLVLKASVELAHSVHNGISVLTHCSDGWDRTAQMVSLAEMMLDPYYRTLRGFQALIEKEWCSFGHQFAVRCGHARSDAANEQRSPVFLLWLDCVWQFTRQFPSECEFNEYFLLTLADHLYSCKYGTFMFDSDKQRRDLFAKHRVYSIWGDINSNSEKFTNAYYAPTNSSSALLPSTLSKNIKLWKGYFCRWDPTMIPPVAAFQSY